MALQLIDAITDGTRRVLTRTGVVLLALLFAQQLLLVTSLNTLIAAEVPPEAADVIGLSLPVSGTVAGAILLGAFLFTAVYFVILARAFARPMTRLSSFPTELYTRRIGRATLTMLVGGIVVFLAIMIGFVLFFIPGLFLAVCFLFVIFTVGVEDRGVLSALKRSWSLSKGNRLRLAVIVVFSGISGSLIGAVPALFQVAGASTIGDLVSVLLNSILFTFIYGVTASAYLQLAEDDGDRGDPNVVAATSSGTAPEV
ncbi:hypothetical protein [Salinigranum salinum]|uniref:hypothetical protein n=1 Tax=Salinigranum salinum TaxID=1364937 RepID=UPI001260E979|nr:hypothetical protein [Salinigranum salinum]